MDEKYNTIQQQIQTYADILKVAIERRDLLHQNQSRGEITYHSDETTIHYYKDNGHVQSAFITLDNCKLAIGINFSTDESKTFEFRCYNLQANAIEINRNELFRLFMNIPTIRLNSNEEIEPTLLLSSFDLEHIRNGEEARKKHLYSNREVRISDFNIEGLLESDVNPESFLENVDLNAKEHIRNKEDYNSLTEDEIHSFLDGFLKMMENEKISTQIIGDKLNEFKYDDKKIEEIKKELGIIMRIINTAGADVEETVETICTRKGIDKTRFFQVISLFNQIIRRQPEMERQKSVNEAIDKIGSIFSADYDKQGN